MVNTHTLTHDFEDKLKSFISTFEEKTPIEIVPIIIKKASSYTAWSYVYGFIASYMPARLISHYLPFWNLWTFIIDAFIWFFLGALFALVLRRVRFFSRLIPVGLKRERTMQMAESLFLNEGVHETRQRLGILIAVFEFEKAVLVLADRGFYPHVKSDYWTKLGATLAKDFDHEKPGDEFFEALHEIERDVAPHFKLEGENKNELSDKLRKK